MSDLIDRQSALNIASGYCHPSNITDELAKLPCVNVLKCVECMHWKEYTGIRKEKTHICEIFDWFSKKEDFCSCAERKDGDNDG